MSTIKFPFGAGPDTNISNIGTLATVTGLTVSEFGNETYHKTVFTMAAMPVGSPAGAASLGFGKLIYTLPTGACVIKSAKINYSLACGGTVTADTPDVGIGTVIAVGAVATLDGTGTFENIQTGQTFNDCNGTAEVKTTLTTASPFNLVIETADAHTIHVNVADGWAGADAITATGTIEIEWTFVG